MFGVSSHTTLLLRKDLLLYLSERWVKVAICSKWSCPLSYQLWLMGPDGHIPLGSISTNAFRNSLVARNRNQLRESYESKLPAKNTDRKDKRAL